MRGKIEMCLGRQTDRNRRVPAPSDRTGPRLQWRRRSPEVRRKSRQHHETRFVFQRVGRAAVDVRRFLAHHRSFVVAQQVRRVPAVLGRRTALRSAPRSVAQRPVERRTETVLRPTLADVKRQQQS